VLFAAGVLLSTVLLQDAPPAADSSPRARLTILPVGSYSDVTGLQYGATVLRGFRVGTDSLTRASSISAYIARTAKGHAKAYVQLDRWSANNATRWRVRAEHISYPLPFFGIGASTPDSAEEWYSSGVSTVQVFTQHRLKGPTFVHGGARYVQSRLREFEPGGMLQGAGRSNVLISELGVVIDSRGHASGPRTGTWLRAIPSIASRSLGSDVSWRRLTIDARQYRPLGSTYVAAFQLQYDGIAGTAPFDLLPMIGSDTAMRGYPRGRFRDQHALTSQAEVRSPYWRRVGMVAFAGAGTVAPRLSKISQSTWYPSLGAGLRYNLPTKERTVLRMDLGVGRGSFGINLGIGEAF
jgi:outer membrane protein assembly factor BamA